jgi:hypothetical protein
VPKKFLKIEKFEILANINLIFPKNHDKNIQKWLILSKIFFNFFYQLMEHPEPGCIFQRRSNSSESQIETKPLLLTPKSQFYAQNHECKQTHTHEQLNGVLTMALSAFLPLSALEKIVEPLHYEYTQESCLFIENFGTGTMCV